MATSRRCYGGPGLPRSELSAAEGTATGRHQDRIRRFSESRLKCALRQIVVQSRNFKGALPVKWSGPDLRADSPTVAIESVELTHQGLSRPTLGSVLGSLGSAVSGAVGAAASASFGL